MTDLQFKDWLNRLKNAWETKNPKAAVSLCAEEFIWYETPFEKPITTREELLKEWESVLNHENISVTYEILSINGNEGIAHWSASFTRLPSKEVANLDGIYKVSLDEKGECTEFHQWYNSE